MSSANNHEDMSLKDKVKEKLGMGHHKNDRQTGATSPDAMTGQPSADITQQNYGGSFPNPKGTN